MGNHVFICYAREEGREFVFKLAANLKARGVPIWLGRDLPAGANWPKSIDDAIRNCAQFLVVLSPKAVESKHVQGEWLTALDEEKIIVPVIYQTCRIPPPLRSWQHVDFTNRDAGNETALEQLVRVLGETSNSDEEKESHPREEADPLTEGLAESKQFDSQETIAPEVSTFEPRAGDQQVTQKTTSKVPKSSLLGDVLRSLLFSLVLIFGGLILFGLLGLFLSIISGK